ncbi:hypothetical protein V5D56_13425 [Cellulosimicrobium sp. PMB13]|uniref:hypothetical protein n=1 Tax=Cellulosimicrobium sp. PMB13 TaxID=3120158 RepID=UPI003F4B1EE9
MTEQDPKKEGGLGDLLGQAKEFLTDERIDQVAGAIKGVAPDSVDKHVDTLADKAKQANGDDADRRDVPGRGAEGS